MKRISPKMVIKAYEDTKMVPMRKKWGSMSAGVACGCAITALCLSKKPELLEDVALTEDFIYTMGDYDHIRQLLGPSLNDRYISGFTQGFDGGRALHDTEEYVQGHGDGITAYEEVSKKLTFVGE